ncbi:hypothetical protein C4F51_13830 [Cellvibrio sp. KB43]|uniref:Uncharacterized protein n=2 Tax=Cellvibrio polysaccharolyticus TaxID=2082724 RepID=A0A928V3X9_9GAMM|nr:hypothetical protein [Cellvibrio polysaccharolyticus]
MPDFDLKSSITVLSAAAITTIITVFLLLLILVIPGAYWSNAWANSSKLKHLWENENGDKKHLGVAKWFLAPMVYFYFLLFFTSINWPATLACTALGVALLWLLIRKERQLTKKELSEEIGSFLATSLFTSCLMLLPTFLIIKITSSAHNTPKGSPLIIGITVAVIVFVNFLVAVKPGNIKAIKYYLALGLGVLIFILSSFEVIHRIPTGVMEAYKFGNFKAESIVLKESACKTIKLLGITPSENETNQCVLKDSVILSRLGNELYIRNGGIEFTIQTNQVNSWSIINNK